MKRAQRLANAAALAHAPWNKRAQTIRQGGTDLIGAGTVIGSTCPRRETVH